MRSICFIDTRTVQKAYVEYERGINEYRCAKDGGEYPVYERSESGEEQLVHDTGKKGAYHCFACSVDYTEEEWAFCEWCGCLMRRNEDVPNCQNSIEEMEKE